jgi:carbon monoxide dehydrogenase subunit G
MRLTVSVDIDAPPAQVWAAIEDVATHVEWMAEAVAIRFRSERRRGIGTEFECETKVGPLRTTDVMLVTEWEPGRVMGVRHRGLVDGVGRFTLAALAGGGHTRFTWDERLHVPWRLGGWMAKPVLLAVWRKNLARLKATVEATGR